jgi:hypothetical protein
VGKGGIGSPFVPDSGLTFPDDAVAHGCSIGETECGGACTDTQRDRMHCGDCGTQCGADQYCVLGMCVDRCTAPLQLCMGECVDYANDEENCGSCGHICVSGICTDGACADVIPGSLIVVGHDFSAAARSTPPAMKTIAGNAVFLASGTPVQVLLYRGTARSAEYSGVVGAINANGNAWKKVEVDADGVVAALRDADALVILPQDASTDAELHDLGQRWGLALSQFVYRGGVVVLFDTPTAANTGTYQVLEPAGLFTATGRESIPRQTLTVKTPGFDIAAKAPSSYRSSGGSVHFLGAESDALVVVEDGQGQPVVLHRAVSP